MPLFSVIIPSHARADLLARLLASLSAQTMKDFEAIVVDDASPDSDAYDGVVDRFSRQLELRYFRNARNSGAQVSRNRGVSESRGAFLAFVDDDDEWLPGKLERQAALFSSASPRVGLLYSWADGVDDQGRTVHRFRPLHRRNVLNALLESSFVPSPTVAVRRAALDASGLFDESLTSCQDWDMWTRIAAAGFEFDVTEEVLALYHMHGGASIGSSPRSLHGYASFFAKHAGLYATAGMTGDLSEHYRGLAYRASASGNHDVAGAALRRSVELWPGNWKAWVRYAQHLVRSRSR